MKHDTATSPYLKNEPRDVVEAYYAYAANLLKKTRQDLEGHATLLPETTGEHAGKIRRVLLDLERETAAVVREGVKR